jgi:hypothetical protein
VACVVGPMELACDSLAPHGKKYDKVAYATSYSTVCATLCIIKSGRRPSPRALTFGYCCAHEPVQNGPFSLLEVREVNYGRLLGAHLAVCLAAGAAGFRENTDPLEAQRTSPSKLPVEQ